MQFKTPYDFLMDANFPLEKTLEKFGNPEYEKPRKEFIKEMKLQGYNIVLPKSNELQIDIDTPEQLEAFYVGLAVLMRNDCNWPAMLVEMHPSKSGTGKHATVKLPYEITDPIHRIALQACLGSDPVRELLALIRYKQGDPDPILFVETPEDRRITEESPYTILY